MWEQITTYFQNDLDTFILAVRAHIMISMYALMLAVVLAVPMGMMCVRYKSSKKFVITLFGILRVILSLAILILFIPILGTGLRPALVALILLGIPPILMNTVAGLEEVPEFMIETAVSCGMTSKQVWRKVLFPLAMPLILAGIKTAAVEVIASATLAAKIGAGGLGEIIFTGLGLNRPDLLVIGGVSVAILSSTVSLLFEITDKKILKYKN